LASGRLQPARRVVVGTTEESARENAGFKGGGNCKISSPVVLGPAGDFNISSPVVLRAPCGEPFTGEDLRAGDSLELVEAAAAAFLGAMVAGCRLRVETVMKQNCDERKKAVMEKVTVSKFHKAHASRFEIQKLKILQKYPELAYLLRETSPHPQTRQVEVARERDTRETAK
jgi:hypothetical protein